MLLEVKNLKKIFNDQLIWDNLSCQINKGEVVSIQGKSGEGKTTFLRCLNGLETYDDGTILLEGKKLESEDDFDARNMGMVFQYYNLFPHMTVWENLVLAPNYHGMEKKGIEERGNSLLSDMDLLEHKDKYPSQLSGGQKQRVAIARACMLNPKILSFDEPTSSLDEISREQIKDIILRLAKNGMTIIVVTHDKDFARAISNRILHIENGQFREEIV